MDEIDLTDETVDLTAEIVDLTAEQMVAVDTAMLLDLGEAEALADRIAAQSLGGGDTVADRRPAPDAEIEVAETATAT
jgi:hypothetical protein